MSPRLGSAQPGTERAQFPIAMCGPTVSRATAPARAVSQPEAIFIALN